MKRRHTLVAVGLTIMVWSQAARALNVTVPAGANIQPYIDQVAAAGGGTVSFGPGTWTLSQSLVMKSNVTLNGAGSNSSGTIFQGPNTTYDFPLITTRDEGLTNLTVKHILIDGRIPKSALTTDPNASNPYSGALVLRP